MLLKNSGVGCWIGPHYYGIQCYADDCALLSPDLAGLQKMMDICKKYFDNHKISISTNIDLKKSKTKCIAFGTKATLAPIKLKEEGIPFYAQKQLPWVDTWPHLGHCFHEDKSPDHDLLQRRGQFIGKLHSLRQEFGDKDPIVYTNLVSIYLSSFYGSNLWNLFDDAAEKLYKSWNIMVRYTFDIPRTTHKYLITPVSQNSHLKEKLVQRFLKFYQTLKTCDKPHRKYLMKLQESDYRSVFGSNVNSITAEASAEDISEVLRSDISYAPVPPDEEWRIPLLLELLEIRAGRLDSPLSSKEVEDIIDIVTST